MDAKDIRQDSRLDDALELIFSLPADQTVGVSFLQRKLGIGYPRAGAFYDYFVMIGVLDNLGHHITREEHEAKN